MMRESGSVDMGVVTASLEESQRKIASYVPADIYNMDKIRLFYKFYPHQTITQFQLGGLKKSKKRFIIAFTANADGAIEQEIGEGIQAIGVVTLFDVTNFINPAGENKSSLEELIDEELMKMTTDGSLEDEEEDVAADPSQMSTNEKLHHLTKAMKLLDLSKPSHASCYVVFCTL
ncbi:hypothetical protein AXG93_406s1160 [Marchantia polymorpha subsp. ruderalis]|uniref:Uncharacterized protein n=1 Tax=Marchantia polymorpha subsp. ruderalis TaxID=1480154 RepID=A0A176VB79_MARPO|nr:hypothetical protein AXG93_406s1160 [Marchantia polymorpha subsp. ruderalis]